MKTRLLRIVRRVAKACLPYAAWPLLLWRRLAGCLSRRPCVIVLSLGELGNSAICAREARAQGFRVVVFCQHVPYREVLWADGWARLDCQTDFDKAEKIARRLKPKGILVAEKNLLLPMQAHLADALGLRSVGAEAAHTSNSKIALRRAFDRDGVANLPWSELDSFRDGDLAYPLVLKPDTGTASKGVRFIASRADLAADADYQARLGDDASVGGPLIVESYVEGRQFDVEGLARDGTYHPLVIVEEMYRDAPPYFPPSWFLFNPPIAETLREAIFTAVRAALRALGVRNGAWHCEVRVERGGTVRVLDYANRMGYNQLVSKASGVNFAASYVRLMTDDDFTPPEPARKMLMRFMSRDPEQTARLARLARERPEVVCLSSFLPFEFSYHRYLSLVAVTAGSFPKLAETLDAYGLIPPVWYDFYDLPDTARPAAAGS